MDYTRNIDRIPVIESEQMKWAWYVYTSIIRGTGCRSIRQAYKHPSKAKIAAWHDCEEWCKSVSGFNLSVIYANCQLFSAGFVTYDPVDGCSYFVYITKARIQRMPV